MNRWWYGLALLVALIIGGIVAGAMAAVIDGWRP